MRVYPNRYVQRTHGQIIAIALLYARMLQITVNPPYARSIVMITGELKNKMDSLWEIFWTGGLTNPLDVIEQMTYLMFIHDLDATDNTRAMESTMLGIPYTSIFSPEITIGDRTIDGTQLKWSVFHDFPAARMYSVMQEWVFPFIKGLHSDKDSAYSKYMGGRHLQGANATDAGQDRLRDG